LCGSHCPVFVTSFKKFYKVVSRVITGTGLLWAQAYYGHRLIMGTGLLRAQAYYRHRLITGRGLLQAQAYYAYRLITGTGLFPKAQLKTTVLSFITNATYQETG